MLWLAGMLNVPINVTALSRLNFLNERKKVDRYYTHVCMLQNMFSYFYDRINRIKNFWERLVGS